MKQPSELLNEFKQKYKPHMEWIHKKGIDWKLDAKVLCKLAEECKRVILSGSLPYPLNCPERKKVEVQIERLNNES
jgi:hypothetical protein